MTTDPAALRRELAELLVEALSLASDAQVAAVLRAWADGASCATAIFGPARDAPQEDCVDPERVAVVVQRINGTLTSLRAQ